MATMEPLAFYREPARMTSPGRHAARLDPLPSDVSALCEVAQGLVIHEHFAFAYGVALSDADRATVQLRRVEDLLGAIIERDNRPLIERRPPQSRVAGNCRHFSVLTVALLRAKGVPARARCGFGGYFNDGAFEDHWVVEYWNVEQSRWVLVDAQIDSGQRRMLPIDFDVTDVPRDRFLIGADAWERCRAGDADPNRFGLSMINETGLWWVAGNLIRDAAALGNLELLPWDTWGAMPSPEDPIDDDLATFLDHLAVLTQKPDECFDELRALLATDSRVAVPGTVNNHALQRDETI